MKHVFFSAGFCIFQRVTCRGVFIFHIFNVNHFSTIGNFLPVCNLAITSLDIFRLGNTLSHNMGEEHIHINPFLTSVPILYPLKTPGNKKASGVFREYKMRVMAQNIFIKFIMQR